MSVAHMGLAPWNRGLSPSDETRARLSAAHVGRKMSLEMRAKLFVANWKGGRAMTYRKSHAKRRVLDFIPMNQPFDGCEGHHINQRDVIYIPYKLHHSVSHNVWTGKNMERINALATSWLTEDWT